MFTECPLNVQLLLSLSLLTTSPPYMSCTACRQEWCSCRPNRVYYYRCTFLIFLYSLRLSYIVTVVIREAISLQPETDTCMTRRVWYKCSRRTAQWWPTTAQWMNEWMNDWMTEWMNDWMNEWRNEGMKEWMTEWLNDWMTEWLNEWLNDWMNEWMNREESTSSWRLIGSVKQSVCSSSTWFSEQLAWFSEQLAWFSEQLAWFSE
jgi:hypothetical protein